MFIGTTLLKIIKLNVSQMKIYETKLTQVEHIGELQDELTRMPFPMEVGGKAMEEVEQQPWFGRRLTQIDSR